MREAPTSTEHGWPAIARPGWGVIAVIFAAALLLSTVGFAIATPLGVVLGTVGAVVILWSLWFFRDPPRRVPHESGLIISPADGRFLGVATAAPPAELELAPDQASPRRRLSIFMNIFDVHVNRAPEAGVVERLAYRKGRFVNASFDKASEGNERSSMLLRLENGAPLVVVQIAGLVARRIVGYTAQGERLARGQRYGMIRFGSRLDVYLPEGYEVLLKPGDRCVAGETVLARAAETRANA